MGRPSSDPIRCANQNSERKDPSRGYVLGEVVKERNPSRVSVIVVRWAYFMAYGVIESISMSTFVDGALAFSYHFLSAMFFQTL